MHNNEIETTVAFPSHVYTVMKPGFLPAVRQVSYEALKHAKFENELHPCKMSASLHEDPRMQDFAAYVAITSGNILTDQGYATQGMGAYFESMWCQEHHKYSGMDQHTHPGVQMVGFYFIDVPENSSVLTFFDPRAGKVATGPAESNPADVTFASSGFHLQPQEGLLVITNSWLPHAVTRHGGSDPLRFIHFNIGLTEHKPQSDVEIV